MSQELIYTSAPRGLKPGSRGFCTVQSTQGMARNLADQLENLSGYRHVFPPSDPQAVLNPVAWSHWKITVGGRPMHVLSRIADAGLDYTQRTNKFVHHVVLDPEELVPAGPAWVLGSGLMQTTWDGTPRILPRGRAIPSGNVQPAVCQAWQAMTGDAGWAGVLAETAASGANRQAVIVFRPGMDLLPLLAEAVALLPPADRWGVTFTTYFTRLPPGVTCNWRCALADTPEALAATRAPHTVVIDLCRPLGMAPDSALVESARTGQKVAALWDRKVPARPSAVVAQLPPDEPSQPPANFEEEPALATRPPRRSAGEELLPVGPPPRAPKRAARLPAVFDDEPAPRRSPLPWIAMGVSALLLVAAGGAALWTYFKLNAAPQIAQNHQANGNQGAQQPQQQPPNGQNQGAQPAKPPIAEASPSNSHEGTHPMPDDGTDAGAEPDKDAPDDMPKANGTESDMPKAADPEGDREDSSGSSAPNVHRTNEATPNPPKDPVSGKEQPSEGVPQRPTERNPFEGIPKFIIARGDPLTWTVPLTQPLPDDADVALIGGSEFLSEYHLALTRSNSGDAITWQCDYFGKSDKQSSATALMAITAYPDNLRIEMKKNSPTINHLVKLLGLRLSSRTHLHIVLLHNPNQYIPERKTSPEALAPFMPHPKSQELRPPSVLLDFPPTMAPIIEWRVSYLDNRETLKDASNALTLTPLKSKRHQITLSLVVTPSRGNARQPKLSISPRLLADPDVDSRVEKLIEKNSQDKRLTDYCEKCVRDIKRQITLIEADVAKRKKTIEALQNQLTTAQGELKKATEDELEKMKKIQGSAEQDLENLKATSDSIVELQEFIDTMLSEESRFRLDYDIYAAVSDPREEGKRLELLMYTTDPKWEDRPVVRPLRSAKGE